MKAAVVLSLASLALGAICPSILAQEASPAGIVYGPKASFNITAPEGWVVDNESGKRQDLPCVLYPKAESWSDAKTVMYAKVASPQWEGVNAFVATAIKEMKAKHGTPKEKIASGKTKDGHVAVDLKIDFANIDKASLGIAKLDRCFVVALMKLAVAI